MKLFAISIIKYFYRIRIRVKFPYETTSEIFVSFRIFDRKCNQILEITYYI